MIEITPEITGLPERARVFRDDAGSHARVDARLVTSQGLTWRVTADRCDSDGVADAAWAGRLSIEPVFQAAINPGSDDEMARVAEIGEQLARRCLFLAGVEEATAGFEDLNAWDRIYRRGERIVKVKTAQTLNEPGLKHWEISGSLCGADGKALAQPSGPNGRFILDPIGVTLAAEGHDVDTLGRPVLPAQRIEAARLRMVERVILAADVADSAAEISNVRTA